ncbi:MAG: hypothetical protein IID46_12440 [Planctomycetes bacterium]|nr:hypothetical protein [Planctomycetota bacterium]
MRLALAIIFTLFLFERPVEAEDRTFPYEAVVTQNQTEVYSGAGFYATGRLSRRSRVRVHRHDPEGWYVITPPPGSISWIRAEYVQRSTERFGTVIKNDVMVRVGSSLNDSRNVYQVKLSKGDRVEILGDQKFDSEQGPVRAYKIVPPQGEFRWIQGKYVTSIDKIARSQGNLNQFSNPSNAQSSISQTQASSETRNSAFMMPTTRNGKRTPKKQVSTRRDVEEPDDFLVVHEQMNQLDRQFRAIIQRETGTWDFAQLESDYHALQRENTDSDNAILLNERLAAVKRYQKVKQEYDDFIQLTAKTSRRDVQLLALQNRQVNEKQEATQSSQQQPILLAPQTQQVPAPIPVAPHTRVYRPESAPTFRPSLRPVPNPMTRFPGRSGRMIPQQRIQNGRKPMFDGAGIIRRSTVRYPGSPRHVLTAPDGRILAYLKGGWGTSLDRYVGQAMGVNGPRSYRPDLQSHLIRVRTLRPVRLSQ